MRNGNGKYIAHSYPPREQMRGAWPHWHGATDEQRRRVAAQETASNRVHRGAHTFTEPRDLGYQVLKQRGQYGGYMYQGEVA